jgi:hypothetical protein
MLSTIGDGATGDPAVKYLATDSNTMCQATITQGGSKGKRSVRHTTPPRRESRPAHRIGS